MAKDAGARALRGANPHQVYFRSLEAMFQGAEAQIANIVPHFGEQGRILEEYLRRFLQGLLPEKYAVGSGIIVDSAGNFSSQTDVIIYDRFHNSQIFTEYSQVIFPIECVYGIVEVKKNLRVANLEKIVSDIAKVRQMAKNKQYLTYEKIDKPDGRRVTRPAPSDSSISPRSFVFAYSAKCSADSLSVAFHRAVEGTPNCHVHALYVLEKKWLLRQKPYSEEQQSLKMDVSFAEFCLGMLTSMGSMNMRPTFLESYITPPDLDGDEVVPPSKARRRRRRRRTVPAKRAIRR